MSYRFTFRKLLALALTILVPSVSWAQAQGQKYALLVGIDRYSHDKLPALAYAEADVAQLNKVFQEAGYKVTLLTGSTEDQALKPTKVNIEKQVERVLGEARDKTDIVVVAFSGHGMQFGKQKPDDPDDAYFCPQDGKPFRDQTASLVSLSRVYQNMERSLSGMKLLLIDACRDDPDAGRGARGITSDNAPRPPQGVAALFSCRAGEKSYEHDKLRHGVFYYHVIEGLKGKAKKNNGRVTFTSLTSYVMDEVADGESGVLKLFDGGARQSPNLIGNFSSDPVLLIVRNQPWQRGKELLEQHDYQSAVEVLTRVVEKEPNESLARVFRAEALMELGKLDNALEDCNEAIRLNGTLAPAFAVRAEVRNLRKDPGAMEDADRAIALAPREPDWRSACYRSRGVTYLEKKDYERAIDDLNRAIRFGPQDAHAYFYRGRTYFERKEYELAIRDYSDALRIDPKYARAYLERGRTYRMLAMQDGENAGRLDPKYGSLAQQLLDDATRGESKGAASTAPAGSSAPVATQPAQPVVVDTTPQPQPVNSTPSQNYQRQGGSSQQRGGILQRGGRPK